MTIVERLRLGFSKLFPLRYQVACLQKEVGELKQHVRELNKHAYEKSSLFRQKMEFLGQPGTLPYPLGSLHHELSVLAGRIKPEMYLTDPSAPCICTIAMGSKYVATVQPCLDAAKSYAQLRGYNYLLLTIEPDNFARPVHWLRFPLIWRALEMGFQNIFYLDSDALVTNHSTKLEPFFARLDEAKREIMITKDYRGLNNGVFFVKNSPRARVLLDLIWDNDCYSYEGFDFFEQAAMQDLTRYRIIEDLYLLAAQRDFNSYVVGEELGHWQKGDFILHFAGFAKERIGQKIKECGLTPSFSQA